MGKITKEEIISNLKYLGIDDGNFPDYLKEYNPVSFRTSRMQNDKDHKLFQFYDSLEYSQSERKDAYNNL